MVRIVSYNLNGIRSAITKGFLNWMETGNFDIVCVQELKAQIQDLPLDRFTEMGYECFFHPAVKKGYSGVAIFTKKSPLSVVQGCGMEKYDIEGRILRADFEGWSLLNCYFPSGTMGEERQRFKMEFLDDFYNWVIELRQTHPRLVVVGDFNIAHQEIDIHDPKRNQRTTGFLPEERAWMTQWLESGFVDAFRYKNPDKVEYSWWSWRSNMRSTNRGWRIDYQCVSSDMAPLVQEARQLGDALHSDHCPVLLEMDLPAGSEQTRKIV